MARTIDRQVATARGSDLLGRAARVALVAYLSPVIVAVLAVGLVAVAVVHLGGLMASFHPHAPGIATPRARLATVAAIVGRRVAPSPLA